jgi:acyl-CoA reductase-like NAD-dependent aldehyde dehydrogenase
MTSMPAIAAGNTVVLKTSEVSPASQLLAAELLQEVSTLSHSRL